MEREDTHNWMNVNRYSRSAEIKRINENFDDDKKWKNEIYYPHSLQMKGKAKGKIRQRKDFLVLCCHNVIRKSWNFYFRMIRERKRETFVASRPSLALLLFFTSFGRRFKVDDENKCRSRVEGKILRKFSFIVSKNALLSHWKWGKMGKRVFFPFFSRLISPIHVH